MPNIVPVITDPARSLAGVVPSSLEALRGRENPLDLPPVRHAIVVLVDGLGSVPLHDNRGHARFLASRVEAQEGLRSGFPATTVAGIASLTLGTLSGEHGMLGYSLLDRPHDRVVNLISGWDARFVPETWQPRPSLFARAEELGIAPVAIGPKRYRASGLTRAVLRGARYVNAEGIRQSLEAAMRIIRRAPSDPHLVYVYHPYLDMAAHAQGTGSEKWRVLLEELDAELAGAARDLRGDVGLLVTADHGMVDVQASGHTYVEGLAERTGVHFIGGDPRCLQLYLPEGVSPQGVAEAWSEEYGDRAWVVTRERAVLDGWFGHVTEEYERRLGDVLVAASRPDVAFYDRRTAKPSALRMVGQHGSWSEAEQRIPLVRLGGFDPA